MEIDNVLIEKEVEIEEEESILSQVLVSPKSYEWINNETIVVVIKVEKSEMSHDLSQIKICGKSMLDWVLIATSGPKQEVIDNASDEKLLQKLKLFSLKAKYVFVAYSDTPFLEKRTFCEVMDYFCRKGLNAMALPRGYVFRSEYLQLAEEFGALVKKSFGKRDFQTVDNSKLLMELNEHLSQRIKAYHISNGVVLFSEQTIQIDADVEIESGVIIYPNNILLGQTYLGRNVVLESGNIIEDSVIEDNCVIKSSKIYNSKIQKNKHIGPFAKMNGESI